MHLVQILLPTTDNSGVELKPLHQDVRHELTEHFGGLTAYSRSPADGIWKDSQAAGAAHHDQIIVYEVMTEALDVRWWHDYRKSLETRFRQMEVVVREQPIRLL